MSDESTSKTNPGAYQLPYANLGWQDNQTPFAQDYEDVYWSIKGGLEEKQYVFIDGCKLLERWCQLKPYDSFSIVELGFGFGLNFLLTLRAWRNSQQTTHCHLDYVSYEAHLVPIDAMEKIACEFGLEQEFGLLKSQYPKPIPGVHTIWLDARCCLHLVVGDATEYAPKLKGEIDALYLDGFSPKFNEKLWQSNLITSLAQQLRPGAIAATYSVAGDIRRSLQAANINVEKVTGFGSKRHMMLAMSPGKWKPKRIAPKKIAIVGAGLTGLFCAEALERYGHEVTVIDANAKYGAVSNIHQIAIYPQLSQTPQNYSNLYLRAFSYFQNHQSFAQCGRLELLTSPESLHKGKRLAEQLTGIVELVSAEQCSQLLGFEVAQPGLFTQSAGWLAPQLIGAQREVLKGHVRQLIRLDSQPNWRIKLDAASKETNIDVDVVVLACGPHKFNELEPLDLLPLRGQSIRVKHTSQSPKVVFSNNKTWFPSQRGYSTVSGTYSRKDLDTKVRDEDSQELIQSIEPYIKQTPDFTAQVGIRSAARDRLPVVDQIPNWQQLNRFVKNSYTRNAPKADAFEDYVDGLYCSVGFGSHAGTLGPYCAEILTRHINRQIQAEDTQQISSSRFAFRDIKP